MKLRVLIADDERMVRTDLRKFLQAEPEVEVVGECATGTETLKGIQEQSPDLVLMDIAIPNLDGLEVLGTLRTHRLPAVIFVTAHDQLLFEPGKEHPTDYLLKPFNRERVQRALCRAREITANSVLNRKELDSSSSKANGKVVERIAIRSGGRIIFIRTAEVEWIQSADNYSELHAGKAHHLSRQTLASLERSLPPEKFARISRSYIVNLEFLKEIRPRTHGDFTVVMRDGKELPASRNYRDRISKLLGKAS